MNKMLKINEKYARLCRAALHAGDAGVTRLDDGELPPRRSHLPYRLRFYPLPRSARPEQVHRFNPDLHQIVARAITGNRKGRAGVENGGCEFAPEFLAVDGCLRIDFGEVDQFLAGAIDVQAKEHQHLSDRGVAFADRKQLDPEIAENALGLRHVSDGLVILPDLQRAHGQLPWLWQRGFAEGEHPRESPAPQAKDGPDRPADEVDGNPAPEGDSGNRNQIDIPLHAVAQPKLWQN